MHRMWSVWLLLVQMALNGAYASIGAVQGLMDPVHFVILNVVLSVVVGALRILNQKDVPGV